MLGQKGLDSANVPGDVFGAKAAVGRTTVIADSGY